MCTIAIDFDGTINADLLAAKLALTELKSKGHKIVIWSSRNNPRQHKQNQLNVFNEMVTILKQYDIPYDEIDIGNCGKFHAQVYIDDKCWRFENNWDEIIKRIY